MVHATCITLAFLITYNPPELHASRFLISNANSGMITLYLSILMTAYLMMHVCNSRGNHISNIYLDILIVILTTCNLHLLSKLLNLATKFHINNSCIFFHFKRNFFSIINNYEDIDKRNLDTRNGSIILPPSI
jgi:hypothetical protein